MIKKTGFNSAEVRRKYTSSQSHKQEDIVQQENRADGKSRQAIQVKLQLRRNRQALKKEIGTLRNQRKESKQV